MANVPHGSNTSNVWRRGSGLQHSHNRGSVRQSGSARRPTAPERMDLVASVSRSSGLEADGDTLKNFKVQEEYRKFVQDKIDNVLRQRNKFKENETLLLEGQENVLILLRKLREGISSSRRRDSFAVEVYETSLFLSILFNSSRQTDSIFSPLMNEIYLDRPSEFTDRAPTTVTLFLLWILASQYPSQLQCHKTLKATPHSLFPRKHPLYSWIRHIGSSLHRNNYLTFSALCREAPFRKDDLSNRLGALSLSGDADKPDICTQAFHHTLDILSVKFRDTMWTVISSAYREVACHPSEPYSRPTRQWLSRRLILNEPSNDPSLDKWLEDKAQLGHVRKKDGADGRWTILKPSR